ncbi:MAG: hypothetical protein U0T74_05085 [Chitinophagales bacterium]
MKKLFLNLLFILLGLYLSAQTAFEGTLTVTYKNDKGVASKTEVKVKDQLVYLKNITGGVAKYDYYVLDLTTREFFTVSKSDKKVIIKYHIDKLLELYDKNNLKEGFSIKSPISFKSADKTKEEDGLTLSKYFGETDFQKASFWHANFSFNFCGLIPVLRLMGCWNNIQASDGIITGGEEFSKAGKSESTVAVTIRKETISKDVFKLPESYLRKDFIKLLESENGNKDLNLIVQTFAGF